MVTTKSYPHLDLYNFIEPLADESEYVLTSPRSLEACSRFGIKPMELLPKTTEEFITEFGSYSSYTDDIEVLYKKFERERLKKLRLCREERERIIDEKIISQQNFLFDDKSDEESNEEDIFENNPSSVWHTLNLNEDTEYSQHNKSTREKPSILNFVNAASPSPKLSKENNRIKTPEVSLSRNAFEVVSDLDSDTELKEDAINNNVRRRRSRRANNLSLHDVSEDLPQHLKKNLSLISKKDQRLLDIMMLKANEEKMQQEYNLSLEQEHAYENNVQMKKQNLYSKKRDSALLDKVREREKKQQSVQYRKEKMERKAELYREADLNTKNSKWQREYEKQMQTKKYKEKLKQNKENETEKRQESNLRQLSREKQMWNEVVYQDSIQKSNSCNKKKAESKLNLSMHDRQCAERLKRLEHDATMNYIEEKHAHAQETFQLNMKQRELKMAMNRMKKEERKEQQEKQLKQMDNDLELWQNELKEFQGINEKRADQAILKRNTKKSQKAYNSRFQKELDHNAVKLRLEEEEMLRQEELKATVSLKEQRANLIQNEKEEYIKVSREAARASRTVRDIIKEQTIKSSFDKMALNAEQIARIERLGQQHKKPSSLVVGKSVSAVTFG